jgi:hypothetical protein
MTRWIGPVVLLLAVAFPATALGGGYATLGLQSLPEGIEPGEPWTAEFVVLAHGRTPFVDGHPSVTVSRADGELVDIFPARLVNQDGLYRARVVFPEAGRYDYVIDDGYSQRHTFPQVTVRDRGGDPAPAPSPAPAEPAAAGLPADNGSSVPLALALAAGAGLLAAWLVLMLLSRRGRAGGEPPLDTWEVRAPSRSRSPPASPRRPPRLP